MAKTLEQAISDRRRALGNQYAYIDELEEIAEIRALRRKAENPYAYADDLDRLRRPISRFDGIDLKPETISGFKARRYNDSEIEQFARELLVLIWENRAELFPDYSSRHPIDMLDPVAAFGLLGYQVDIVGALGQLATSDKQLTNVAGLIDKASRKVLLSSAFPPAVRNFTAAHELGHALMHNFAGAHRDKPRDGSFVTGDWREREAEKFAAYFLMPAKLVKKVFEETFGKAPFFLNDETRFALSGSLPSEHWQPKTVRDLSRVLSSASRFNGGSIFPLMNRFRVSREAMAIRLEQLGLVCLDKAADGS